MAGHTHLVFGGDGNDAFEEIGNPLPVAVGIDCTGAGEGRIGVRVFELVGVVAGVAAAGGAAGAQDTEDAHVVFDAGDFGRGTVLDHGLDLLDVAVAFGALGEHDGGMAFAID